MKKISQWRTVFARELASYFNSPIAYIFIIVFGLLTTGLFMSEFFLMGSDNMRSFFGMLPVILCIFIPAITMRIWAEERSGNTFELLLTFPMKTNQLVLGKFAASFVFYVTALASTIFVPIMLFAVGKPDTGPIISGYIGALFLGAFFLSVGIFISGLAKDQIVAFIGTIMVCFFFYLTGLDFMAGVVDGWINGAGSFLKEYFGVVGHFTAFTKGVIDGKDIIYFVVMTGIFLALNVFSLEDRMRPKAKLFFAGAVGISLGIALAINFLSSDLAIGRFDCTRGKLYTVTKASKNILRALKAPVTVKLYISPKEKMPTTFKTLEQEIKDKLDEFKIASGGKLSYKVFHMEPANATQLETEDTEAEDSLEESAKKKGIVPFRVQSIEQDEMGIKLVYSAISVAYKDKPEEIVPRVIPREMHNFEYNLLSKIYRMTLNKKPSVALFAPYSEKKMNPQMLELLRQLEQDVSSEYREDKFNVLEAMLKYEDYEVNRILLTRGESIPKETDTLVVVAPQGLTDRQRYEISRFLAEGGSVVIAAQNYEYDYSVIPGRGVNIAPRKNAPGINELLKEYGVTLGEEILMDEKNEMLSLSGGAGSGPFQTATPIKIPIQIMVDQSTMNQKVSITGRLAAIFYMWGTALEIDNAKIKENALKQTILFTSSRNSWEVPYHSGTLTAEDIEIKNFERKEFKPLAVMWEGQFPDVFKYEKIPEWTKSDGSEENPAPAVSERSPLDLKPGKLLVVGCSKMFEEEIIKVGGGMIMFFMNSVDALTLGGELVDIRSHQPVNRAIPPVTKSGKLWWRFITVFLMPIIVVILGVIRTILRRREKERYLKTISVSGGETI